MCIRVSVYLFVCVCWDFAEILKETQIGTHNFAIAHLLFRDIATNKECFHFTLHRFPAAYSVFLVVAVVEAAVAGAAVTVTEERIDWKLKDASKKIN